MKMLNTKKQIYFLLAFFIYFPNSYAATTTVYDVVEIGELDNNETFSPRAYSINENSQVVGGSPINGLSHAYLYENGVMTDIHSLTQPYPGSPSGAFSINNNGAITGFRQVSSQGGVRPYILYNNVLTTLGILGGLAASANDINDSQHVVGISHTPNTNNQILHGFLYNGINMIDLGSLVGAGGSSGASSINNNGVIAGWSNSASGRRHPVIFSNGAITDLGMLAGYDDVDYTTGGGPRINEQNTVTGLVTNIQNIPARRGFIYTESTGMVDLGALSSGTLNPQDAFVEVISMNNNDQIVGRAGLDYNNNGVCGGGHDTGFIYENGQMKDLNSSIETSGWTMKAARDINDKGEIVGEALKQATCRVVVVLLTPRTIEVPEDEDGAILIPVKTPTGDIVIIPLN